MYFAHSLEEKKRQIVSNRFRAELTVHALARDEKGIEAVSSEFCTKSIVQTHFLVLRGEGRRSVIGFAMSSQFTHLLEARKGKEQSVMSFIQRLWFAHSLEKKKR